MIDQTSDRPASAERPPSSPALVLRIYVAGNAPNSVRAVANARALCDQYYPKAHHIEIVDLLEEPERALADAIIVTPTLLRLKPLPVQRLIGNLSDSASVLVALAT